MYTFKWCLPVVGAGLVCGCAGPLDQRWDDPVYRSLQDRHVEHDRFIAQDGSSKSSVPSSILDSLNELRVEDAIGIAIENNPQLRAAGYRIDAASGRVVQAGLYPNPSLSFSGESIGADSGSGGETAYVIEQEIVLGDKLQRARDVARSDRSAAQAAFVAQEFAIATQVSGAYFKAVSAREQLTNHQELAALSTQLLDSVRSRVDAGSATETDRLRAEVINEQSQLELESAQYQLESAMRVLSSAIGLEQAIDLPLVSLIDSLPVVQSYEEIIASTLESNSKVSHARIAIERARNAHKLAQADSTPSLIASIGPRYSDIDQETTMDVGLSLEIPLFDRNQGEIKATLSERLSAAADLQSVQLELLALVAEAWSDYQSSHSSAARYRELILPKAQQTFEMTQQAYQSGKVDYLRLLDAQQVVIESRLVYIRALEQLHQAAAMLNQLSQSNPHWRNPRLVNLSNAEVTP